MPYEIGWYVENHVIYDRLYGSVSIQDAKETSETILEYVTTATEAADRIKLIHVIIDMREATSMPMKLNQINKVMVHTDHPRLGWSLFISDNFFMRFLGHTITQISKARFRAFNTLDEALEFLREQDTTIVMPDYLPGQGSPT